MSGIHIPASLRRRVRRRARRCCEYCHHPDSLSTGPFHCDHFLPISSGGRTNSDNLVWACGFCNGCKVHTAGMQPVTHDSAKLVNARADSWGVHCEWSADGLTLRGKTRIGRVTVSLLEMNRRHMKILRGYLLKIGIHPRQM